MAKSTLADRRQDVSETKPVRTLKDFTDEEKAKILANLDSEEHKRATKRAQEARRGKR